jgi:hypothetical protein
MEPDDSNKPKRKKKGRKRAQLTYLGHQFKPEDLLDFIELKQFTKRWEDLGLNDEEDLTALQLMIMVHPKGGDVITGTGGLRKIRFAPADWNAGKSGAARVLYVYFEEFGIVLLCLVYGKNEVSAISDGVKKLLAKMIVEIEDELRRRRAIKLE